MDKYLLYTQMTLEQQLKFEWDKEANKAVDRSIRHKFFTRENQLLPGEDAAVFVKGKKLTSDLNRAIRLEASGEKAKEFLINECKWSSEQFDEVNWDMLDAALEKSQMATKYGSLSSTQGFAAQDYRYPITKDSKGSKPGAPTVRW